MSEETNATVAQIFGADSDENTAETMGFSNNISLSEACTTTADLKETNDLRGENGVSSLTLEEHEEIVSKDNIFALHGINITFPLPCDFCSEKFDDLGQLDVHMFTHKETRFFMCQICPNTYRSWSNLIAHRKGCHNGRVLSCNICEKRKNHPTINPIYFPVENFSIGCEECSTGFNTIIQLYRHYRNCKSHAYIRQQENVESNENQESCTFKCDLCSTCFASTEELNEHKKKLDDDNVICNICKINLCSQDALRTHKKSQHGYSVAAYHCTYCGKDLRSRSSYTRHKLIHSGERPFKCDVCSKTFNRRSTLEYHKYSHPLKEDYRCFNCRMSFGECSNFKTHLEKEHYSKPDTHLICDVCRNDFNVKEFFDHYKECHDTKENRAISDRQANVTCPICFKIFSQPTALNRHLKLHNPTMKTVYTCDLCGKSHVRRIQLAKHMRCHYNNDDSKLPEKLQHLLKLSETKKGNVPLDSCNNRKTFMCEYCGQEFKKSINLKLHIRRHTGDRPYKCQLCGKSFYTNQQLVIHVRQHTGERPYECSMCKKTFTGPGALYMHKITHSKMKQYKCPHCKKEFYWRSAFISHIRLHTGERPYACSLCSKSFFSKSKLNFHLKKHTKDFPSYSCSDCGNTFTTKEELKDHEDDKCCITMVTVSDDETLGNDGTQIILLEADAFDGKQIFVNNNNEVVELIS